MDSIAANLEARLESLISEIETSDAPIGPVLRSVYEDDGQTNFLKQLDDHSQNHDKEIERMCNFHYQGFISSVNELIRVRSDARIIKTQVKQANSELNESGKELLDKLGELSDQRTILRNIAATIEMLTLCMPVLEMYAKLYEQKKSKRYYPALKTLELLENTYLVRIKNFRFAELMKNKLPEFRESIKDAAKEDLMRFLENVRSKDEKLGQIAMKQAHEQYSLNLLHGMEEFADAEDEELELCVSDLVDFSPVYRCLHIFTALNQRDVFEAYYRKERMQQARLMFEWQRGTATIHESFDVFQAYFNQIVGFFVVEDNVMNTTDGLVTRGTLDELWDMAIHKIGTVLRTQCNNLEDASMMLGIKELIVWFSHTLSGYGFSVSSLYDVLLQMRDQYNEMLTKQWRPKFDKLAVEDNYSPLFVNTLQEYSDMVQQFPYEDNTPIDKFPKRYPFSGFVTSVYSEVKCFIDESMKFNENLNISRTEIDNSVRKSANLLLTKTLNESLKTMLAHPSLSLGQLAQMSVNTLHLEDACPSLEKYISDVTGTTDVNVILMRLYGASTFKDVRSDAEQRIFEKLNSKIDEFLGLASYNWAPSNARTQPSSYLVDLIAYLQGAFITFETLTGDVAKTACMSSCKHLAVNLKMFLFDDQVRQLNVNGLMGFDLDLKECESFAASKPVDGFEDGTLELCFQELRQLLTLVIDGDWSTFFSDYGTQTSKYNRVQPQNAVQLLEKMTDNKKMGMGMVMQFKKSEREKKKFTETIIKKLKEL